MRHFSFMDLQPVTVYVLKPNRNEDGAPCAPASPPEVRTETKIGAPCAPASPPEVRTETKIGAPCAPASPPDVRYRLENQAAELNKSS